MKKTDLSAKDSEVIRVFESGEELKVDENDFRLSPQYRSLMQKKLKPKTQKTEKTQKTQKTKLLKAIIGDLAVALAAFLFLLIVAMLCS